MFTIGDFARHGRVSVRMLRNDDATGLLRPARVDPASGYRFYEAVQLARLNRIIALKNLGFSLGQVHAMLDEHGSSCAGYCGCAKPGCKGDRCRYVPAGAGRGEAPDHRVGGRHAS